MSAAESRYAQLLVHEVLNPMTILIGRLGLLRAHLARPELDRQALGHVVDGLESGLERVADLVRELREAWHDPGPEARELVSAASLFDEAARFTARAFRGRGVELEVVNAPAEALVCVAPMGARAALWPLFGRALERTKDRVVRARWHLGATELCLTLLDGAGPAAPDDLEVLVGRHRLVAAGAGLRPVDDGVEIYFPRVD